MWEISLTIYFVFSECQEKATYGFGYKWTVTGKRDDAVLQNAVALAHARIEIDHFHWYAHHYTPSVQQQGLLSKQILIRHPLNFDKLNDLFSWKRWVIGKFGIANWVARKTWMYLYASL